MQVAINKMKLLSSGANSKIYLYGQEQSKVVLKMVCSNFSKQAKHLSNQYQILKQIDHQNIISVLKYKQKIEVKGLSKNQSKSQNGQFTDTDIKIQNQDSQEINEKHDILVLEHARFGSFLDLIKKSKLKAGQVRHFFIQIAQALQFLHCKYIVHRDLKLDNIFITSDSGVLKAKLGDFGFASSCFNPNTTNLVQFNTYKGTKRGYMAPQIHQVLHNSDKFYDARKSDIFALGVVLFAALLGNLPFEFATKQNKLYKLIAQEKYEQFWRHHSILLNKFQGAEKQLIKDFKELFQSMVCYDPEKRFTIEQVLESEWMYGGRIKTGSPQF